MKNICAIATNYALLQILLLTEIKDCVFFCDKLISNDVYLKLGNYTRCYRVKECILGDYFNGFNIYREVISSKKGGSKFLCQDHLWITNHFFKDRYKEIPIYVLEDGMANYIYKFDDIVKKSQTFNHIILGLDDRVNKIYLSGNIKIPQFYNRKKYEQFNIRKLWGDSSQEKKRIIMNIFGIDNIDFDLYKKCRVCLITQPFSGSGKMTAMHQIEMYSEILKKYHEDDVLIKPHPADYIDYKKTFPKVKIFPQDVPFELFYYLFGYNNIEKYITISSTSEFIIDDDKLDKYDMKANLVLKNIFKQ